ncbi:MAG: hypothetical protein AAF390_07310 [Pseudomonadota bacterium]
MAVEIGTLVVKGAFGAAPSTPAAPALGADEAERLRRDILEQVREMLDDADRRAGER